MHFRNLLAGFDRKRKAILRGGYGARRVIGEGARQIRRTIEIEDYRTTGHWWACVQRTRCRIGGHPAGRIGEQNVKAVVFAGERNQSPSFTVVLETDCSARIVVMFEPLDDGARRHCSSLVESGEDSVDAPLRIRIEGRDTG